MNFNPEYIIISGFQRAMQQMAGDLMRGRIQGNQFLERTKYEFDRAQAQFDFLKSLQEEP
jgi:hypothetical protein